MYKVTFLNRSNRRCRPYMAGRNDRKKAEFRVTSSRRDSYASSEFLEDTRINRRRTQQATRECASDAWGHDVLAGQKETGHGCAGVESV